MEVREGRESEEIGGQEEDREGKHGWGSSLHRECHPKEDELSQAFI